MSTDLLSDIERFLSETGMSERAFCRAVGNGRLLASLRRGITPERQRPVRMWPDTEAKIRRFMDVERQRRAPAKTVAA